MMLDDCQLICLTKKNWVARQQINGYARPCLYKLLSARAYESLVLLCQIVSLVSSPILTEDNTATLFDLIHSYHKCFCQVYGKWQVSVNYHMSLHIPDIIEHLGPPHCFWCFPYERLNGILSGFPRSNRNIEIEVFNKFLQNFTIYSSTIINNPISDENSAALGELIDPAPSNDDQPYPQTYWVLCALNYLPEDRFLCQQTLDMGDVNDWPVKLMHPSKLNLRADRVIFQAIQTLFTELYGNDVDHVSPRICKYARCHVNGETFSRNYKSTDRGSVVKVMFVGTNNELTPYFGEVQYYFTAIAVVSGKRKVHPLSYVKCTSSVSVM